MEIGLSSQDLLPHIQSGCAVTLAMKLRVSGDLQGWIHKQPGRLWLYLICFGKGDFILFNLLFKFIFALGGMRFLLYSPEKNANIWGVCFLHIEYLVA